MLTQPLFQAEFARLRERLKGEQEQDKLHNAAASAAMADQGQVSPEDISAANFGKLADAPSMNPVSFPTQPRLLHPPSLLTTLLTCKSHLA